MNVSSRLPGGNLPAVPTRGRPPEYTPEEDAIILRNRDTEEVVRCLVEAGFPQRTPAAIWSRRKYLRESGNLAALEAGLLDADDEVGVLVARRRKTLSLLAEVKAQVAAYEAEVADINQRIHDLIDGDGTTQA